MDFLKIDYLKDGNERQKLAFDTLVNHQIMEKLTAYHPILTGTIPINIDIESSDLDIICYWQDRISFVAKIEASFGLEKDFILRELSIDGHQTIIANFKIDKFEIEIFGQNIPIIKQNAYLHMLIEHRILKEKGEDFRLKVIQLKKEGYKTEPAFAKLLNLKGNPYQSLLQLLSTVNS